MNLNSRLASFNAYKENSQAHTAKYRHWILQPEVETKLCRWPINIYNIEVTDGANRIYKFNHLHNITTSQNPVIHVPYIT
jgi:hypothetical protein